MSAKQIWPTLLRSGRHGLLLAIGVTVYTQPCYADEPRPEEAAAASAGVELIVDAAPEPVPALRYHLLPPAEKQRPGNAAPIYLRIAHEKVDEWRRILREEPSRLLDLPLDAFPLDEVGRLLARLSEDTAQLSAAARRSDCDWEYVVEDRDPIVILLPDVGQMRTYGRLLALKARYEVQSGDLYGALGSLHDGLALARHVAQAQFLVNQLVGIAIGGLILGEADLLVQQPGAPNLYWALAELPRPLISTRRGLETERRLLQMRFPELDRLDQPRAAEDWQRLSRELRAWASEIIAMEQTPAAAIALAEQTRQPATPAQLEAARAYLQGDVGLSDAQVAEMSDAEVEVRYMLALYHEINDAWQKWSFMPYGQAHSRLSQVSDSLRAEVQRRELFPLVSLLASPKAGAPTPQARLDRQVARLMAIEALRMHAAATGALPDSLEAVSVVPLPLDPATGGPFAYTREGDVAVLDVTDEVGMPREALRMPTRIRLRDK